MKPAIAIALVCTGIAVAGPLGAQQTGVAHPPDAMVENTPIVETPQAPAAKPSAAIPYDAPQAAAPPAEMARPAVTLRPAHRGRGRP